jgi:Na+/melibiose symporter-like transporter
MSHDDDDDDETRPFIPQTPPSSYERQQQQIKENEQQFQQDIENNKRRVPFLSQLIFSLPAMSIEALHVFHHTWVTKFFVDDVKFPPLAFAVLHATERSIGIITYPFMGLLVDRTVLSKSCVGCSGRRRIFFYVMAPLLFLAYILIWILPCQLAIPGVNAADDAASVIEIEISENVTLSSVKNFSNFRQSNEYIPKKYFLFIAFTYMFGQLVKNVSPVDLPWMSLGAETTKLTVDRTRLFATKSVISLLGLGIGSIGPVLLMNNGLVSHFQAFSKFVCIMGVLLVGSFYLLASRVVPAASPSDSPPNSQFTKCGVIYENVDVIASNGQYNSNSHRQSNIPFVAGIVMCFDNGPYMRLLLVHGLHSLGEVMGEGMFPFFIQYVLNANHYETWVSALMLIGFISGLIATPCWMWIRNIKNKFKKINDR